jgi:hypothetical protein
MAASEFKVHPQVAHAHDVKGAMEREATAMYRRLENGFITDSRAHFRERLIPELNRHSPCGPQSARTRSVEWNSIQT